MLKEQLGNPPALVSVLDQESNLGMITFYSVIAAHRNHLVAKGKNERHPIDVVNLGKPLDVAITKPRIRRKEAEILRLGRNSIVESDEPLGIRGPDRRHGGNTAIREQHVSFPLSWISRRVAVSIPGGLAHGHGQDPTQVMSQPRFPAGRNIHVRQEGPRIVFTPWPTS